MCIHTCYIVQTRIYNLPGKCICHLFYVVTCTFSMYSYLYFVSLHYLMEHGGFPQLLTQKKKKKRKEKREKKSKESVHATSMPIIWILYLSLHR